MKIKKILLSISILSSIVFFSSTTIVSAQLLPNASGSSTCAGLSATECGNYTISDFIILATNVASWILGIVGSLTLAMFVYGGFMFLISAGSSDKVSQAKKIITAAVIGLIIVFSSWLIIKLVLGTMGISWSGRPLKF